ITTLISFAYPGNLPIPVTNLPGLPDWAKPGAERYDIVAKSALSRPATADERTAMVKALLADRFRLAAHLENRQQDVYELVVARKDGRLGPNMKPSEVDCIAKLAADDAAGVPRWRPTPADMIAAGGPHPPACATLHAYGRTEGDMTMESLALSVGFQVGLATGDLRRAIDKTGLTGSYRVKVEYDPNALRRGVEAASDAGTSIFTALQEQLGLKLEPTKITK